MRPPVRRALTSRSMCKAVGMQPQVIAWLGREGHAHLCVDIRVGVQPQVRTVLPHELDHALEAARVHLVISVDVRDDAHLVIWLA